MTDTRAWYQAVVRWLRKTVPEGKKMRITMENKIIFGGRAAPTSLILLTSSSMATELSNI
jgi:hypothetical protein